MLQANYSQIAAAPPIRAIIIQPDNSYEIREIEQTIQALQGLEAFSTEHCVIWWNEDSKREEMPLNKLATILWWNLCPEMEGRDALQGPVFVTGLTDDAGDSLSVDDDVIDYFKRIERAAREEGET